MKEFDDIKKEAKKMIIWTVVFMFALFGGGSYLWLFYNGAFGAGFSLVTAALMFACDILLAVYSSETLYYWWTEH